MPAQIAIVFRAGKNIGEHTVETFKAHGFKVVRVSRSVKEEESGDVLSVRCDLSQPTQVSDVFEKVRKVWGEPSVIVYNAFGGHMTRPSETFSVSTEGFEEDLAINITSPFVAAREALESFKPLPSGTLKTYLFTANIFNEGPIPGMLTLGTGKIASAHMVELGDDRRASREGD